MAVPIPTINLQLTADIRWALFMEAFSKGMVQFHLMVRVYGNVGFSHFIRVFWWGLFAFITKNS